MAVVEQQPAPGETGPQARQARRDAKALTIGTVCKQLQGEFPDISISKIRYLEDQKLLSPRRTRGGYRVYGNGDVERLRTILRLQRDEFLPLRVIRQELASGRADGTSSTGETKKTRPLRPAPITRPSPVAQYSLEEIMADTGVDALLLKELEDFHIVEGVRRDGTRYYDEAEREIVRAVQELTRYGVAPRNLRVFRTSADRESALLEQIVGPSLRSRSPERRKDALEALESLAAVVTNLKHLLLVRDLRRLPS